MSGVTEFLSAATSAATAAAASTVMSDMAAATSDAADAAPTCAGGNLYSDDDMGVRISAIFVILVGSLLGATFPIFSKRSKKTLMPPVVFFIAKYFGSGVIIATAFIHLLAPANEALSDDCLTGPITEYPWAEGIALMTVFVLFFIELLVMRSGMFNGHKFHESEGGEHGRRSSGGIKDAFKDLDSDIDGLTGEAYQTTAAPRKSSIVATQRGEDHLSHQREHCEVRAPEDANGAPEIHNEKISDLEDGHDHDFVHGSYDDYAAQMTAIFILEFGVIFHSIFIGLTLAVTAPDEFNILYVVLVFHQTFEGLGLGTRLAITPWSKDVKGRWTPYALAVGYALSTPIAIAIGLGVRETFEPASQTALLTNGVFDSISAGILLYTGLVELMAHEFMFSQTMQKARTSVMLLAFFVMALGAGLMALLGKWA